LCQESKKEDAYEKTREQQTRQGFSPSSESEGRFQVEIKTGK
jgi:hypothetical protein